jgi:hypothetical protein
MASVYSEYSLTAELPRDGDFLEVTVFFIWRPVDDGQHGHIDDWYPPEGGLQDVWVEHEDKRIDLIDGDGLIVDKAISEYILEKERDGYNG